LYLAVADFWRHRNADSFLLFLWVGGIFVFGTFVNWTVSGRALLPIAPPVAILIARRVGAASNTELAQQKWWWYAPLAPTLVVALCAMWADYRLANSQREAAEYFAPMIESHSGTVWYQGHWGWQWYADMHGAVHTRSNGTPVRSGDIVIQPLWNVNVFDFDARVVDEKARKEVSFETCRWFATFNSQEGTSFYASAFGSIPFGFVSVEPEEYRYYPITYTGTLRVRKGIWVPIPKAPQSPRKQAAGENST